MWSLRTLGCFKASLMSSKNKTASNAFESQDMTGPIDLKYLNRPLLLSGAKLQLMR